MKHKSITRISAILMAVLMAFSPISVSAAVLLKKGSSGSEVKKVQATLRNLGYFTYPKITGYYGLNTELAVKHFQKDYGINADGKVGNITRKALSTETKSLSVSVKEEAVKKRSDSGKTGSFDWFSKVQYIWERDMNAVVTDVDTGKSFQLRRTFGTNHADVEPLTREDSEIIKEIWGGWSWTRRAVVVQVGEYTLAGSLSAMPHAGLDHAPAAQIVNGRSEGYGRGYNLDAVKNNGADGVLDLHFKNSRTHNTNMVKKAHQDMVEKAAEYIKKMEY